MMKFTIDTSLKNLIGVQIPLDTTHLVCSGTSLESLEGCPNGITELVCSNNKLVSFEFCPSTVVRLDVSNNLLTSLKHCPLSVHQIRCSRNKISSLEPIKNHSTIDIGCSYNHLTNFIGCPDTVRSIISVSNFLVSLEGLPIKMDRLYCSYNQLKSLKFAPIVPILDCSCNLLETLEHCPEGVIDLTCSNNLITTLKHAPSTLQYLRCSHNKLEEYDYIGKNLLLLECLKNNLQLPRYCNAIPEVFSDK